MPRRRLLVALLPPEPLAHEVEGLRTALADTAQPRIPPHLTLVPPTNVSEAALPAVLSAFRAGAAASPSLELDLGPVTTFQPETPVLYLAVAATSGSVVDLRRSLVHGPFERPGARPFVPHVTVCRSYTAGPAAEALASLGRFRRSWHCDRVHLLEERTDHDGKRRWRPVADALLGVPATVVGTGGLVVELAVSTLVPPDLHVVLTAAGWSPVAVDVAAPTGWWLPERSSLVVTARRGLELLGGAVVDLGPRTVAPLRSVDRAHLERLFVVPTHRRQGVGRHLARFVEHLVGVAGPGAVDAVVDRGSAAEAVLAGLGWWLGEPTGPDDAHVQMVRRTSVPH